MPSAGYEFPLLADTDKKVGEAYGVLGPARLLPPLRVRGRRRRLIRYVHRAIAGLTFKASDELIERSKLRPRRSTDSAYHPGT